MRVVLIPMKPLWEAKERLAPTLSPSERKVLSLAMLADVILACRSGFDHVWVLNSDDAAGELAAELGVTPVPDPAPRRGLNASLHSATEQAVSAGARSSLIVAADLPAVSVEDIEALSGAPGVGLAPDRSGEGTNALWRSPAAVIDVAFGANSAAAHDSLARASGVVARVVERPGLALDVDRPEDLAAAWDHGVGAATRRALEGMGLPGRLRVAG